MERNISAFFYEYKYYLFPADCFDVRELRSRRTVTVTRLKEERCMAPVFIYEGMEEETLEIFSPERLFEVKVDLCSSAEYDALLLKQMQRVCPGCAAYEEDGRLEGHHRELSLSGLCFERKGEHDSEDFASYTVALWHRIARRVNELGKCIDEGDMDSLNRICNEETGDVLPDMRFWGDVRDGKYCLGFAPEYHHSYAYRLLLTYIAVCAAREGNPMREAGWQVLPFRAKNLLPYEEKRYTDKLAKLSECENPNAYILTLYSDDPDSEKTDTALCGEFYDLLCGEIGEDIVNATLYDVAFSSDKAGMRPFKEIACALSERALSSAEGSKIPYPLPINYGMNRVNGVEYLPFRDKIDEGMTICPEISFLTQDGIGLAWWLDALSFCYLYSPHGAEDLDTFMWYLTHTESIPEPYRDASDLRTVGGLAGISGCGDGFIVDCYVASEQMLYHTLRAIAPVMREFDAKLVVVNREGVMTYSCGYDFIPID